MPRLGIGIDVFQAAVERMVELYQEGHRIVVSFSGGKDSGVCIEVCIVAARMTGRLPVEVIMRDEEIMFPGTFEYAERMAARPEVSFNWIYANQPIINVFNRAQPYYWVFDPLLPPEQWVRQPPPIARRIEIMHIEGMTIPDRFPPAPGKNLYAVIGLRTGESRSRLMGLFASKGYVTHANKYQVRNVRPVYDWSDGDVWKAICDNHWDYNSAYDVMARLGVKRSQLRIAPPAMNLGGADMLGLAARAWPKWFDLVCQRLPGVRQAAHFGRRAAQPIRRLDETWEQCFQRTCIDTAPAWVADRARFVRDRKLSVHYHHSSAPFPEVTDCPLCGGTVRCWRKMTINIYNGDPFSLKFDFLPYVEPEFFRPGAGTWGGSPAFA